MKKVKIEFLEAIRFNLNQEIVDITALIWTYNKQIKSLELDLSISTPLNIKYLIFDGVKYVVE